MLHQMTKIARQKLMFARVLREIWMKMEPTTKTLELYTSRMQKYQITSLPVMMTTNESFDSLPDLVTRIPNDDESNVSDTSSEDSMPTLVYPSSDLYDDSSLDSSLNDNGDEEERSYTWFFEDGFLDQADTPLRNANDVDDDNSGVTDQGELDLKLPPTILRVDFNNLLNQDEPVFQSLPPFVVDRSLDDTDFEYMLETIGLNCNSNFNSFAFTLKAVRGFQELELEKLRPNFAFRPVDIIRHTLENTTQLARAFSPFPMHKHFQAMYKWFNFNRLQETVCTDTIFVNVPNIGCGSVCAQVFYGVRTKVLNIYRMITKRGAHDSYQDFLREQGIPSILHSDNSGEQNDTRFRATNRELHVKDTTTEAYHPHQNPAETRAISFLKRAGKSLIAMSGAPAEVWLFALKYVARVHNWTSHESLKWKTPHEKRHGVQPDISPLLAYRFFQPVYYYVEDGFPDSGET